MPRPSAIVALMLPEFITLAKPPRIPARPPLMVAPALLVDVTPTVLFVTLEIRLCGSLDKSKLCQGRHTIVEADLLDNLAILELQDGRTGELHVAPCVRRQ
jgi:hypothetical protein